MRKRKGSGLSDKQKKDIVSDMVLAGLSIEQASRLYPFTQEEIQGLVQEMVPVARVADAILFKGDGTPGSKSV